MCTRFVYRGDNIITGFNFDIDIVEWNHKVINTKDCFYIGIMRPDGMRHSYHGVNRNGNVGTLLYVHGNLSGTYQDSKDCITIADLVEKFIQAEVSFDDVLQILKERKIVYAADATMQAMLSDKHGRTLVVEPGIGWREDEGRYSLITNYSILAPESTRPFVMPEDDRYEKASKMLNIYSTTAAAIFEEESGAYAKKSCKADLYGYNSDRGSKMAAVSVYPAGENHNFTGRPRRGKNHTGAANHRSADNRQACVGGSAANGAGQCHLSDGRGRSIRYHQAAPCGSGRRLCKGDGN